MLIVGVSYGEGSVYEGILLIEVGDKCFCGGVMIGCGIIVVGSNIHEFSV